MSINVDETTKKMQAALDGARKLSDLTTQEQRDFTGEERQKVSEFLKTAREAKAALEEAKADEEMRRAINDLGEGVYLVERPGAKQQKQAKTLGEHFTTAEEWVAWVKHNAPSGVIPDSRKGLVSPPLKVKDFGLFQRKEMFQRKELITGVADVSGGAFVESERTGIYEPLGRHPVALRDLISVRQTGSDTVEFVRQTVQVTQAAPVAESNVTDYTGATGQISGEKPEGTMRFERESEVVKTIAVWIPATKRVLSDAPQLRGLIDQDLRDDLAEELETQMLLGNGVGENFTGLANTSGTLSQAFINNIFETTRKALTHLAVTGKQIPTGWLLNPVDWETVELTQDEEGRYYFGGPVSNGSQQLWRVPVMQGFFQTQGLGWLANWRKAVLWDRQQNTISVSDSHADFFIRNMVAILAEMRAAFGVIRPSAFVEVDLDAS